VKGVIIESKLIWNSCCLTAREGKSKVDDYLTDIPLKIWEGINMEPYKNDYTPEEDFALWHLHEIKHRIADQDESPQEINATGQQVIKK
jgi:hypothetical protein